MKQSLTIQNPYTQKLNLIRGLYFELSELLPTESVKYELSNNMCNLQAIIAHCRVSIYSIYQQAYSDSL